MAAFVVLNRDGWFITAHHVVRQFQQMTESRRSLLDYEQQVAAIENDPALNRQERRRRLAQLAKVDVTRAVRDWSAWWSFQDVAAVDGDGIPPVDLAVGRLTPFRPEWVTEYPKLKDPSRGIDSGTSLCKLGYPFHVIKPLFDEPTRRFTLPIDRMPPLFPMEGILTRIVEVELPEGTEAPPYPLKFLETSTPGLRGQSGGPTFDRQGTVWAIQSQTQHLSLGFDPVVPGSKKKEREHQFLNVGWGVHTETICNYLQARGITFEMSDY